MTTDNTRQEYDTLVAERRLAYADALNESLEIFTVSNEDTFEEVMSNGLMPLAKTMGLDRIAIYSNSNIDGVVRLGQVYRWDKAHGGIIAPTESLVTLPDNSVVRDWIETLSGNRHIFRSWESMSEDERNFMDLFSVRSIFLAPVFQHGAIWGAVAFQNHNDGSDFSLGCEDLLRSMANMCTTALIREEKTRIAEQTSKALMQREKMLKALNETAAILLSHENEAFEDVMSKGLKAVCASAGVDRVAVYRLLYRDVRLGQVYLWHGRTIPPDDNLRVVPLDPPVIRWLEILTKGGCINANIKEMAEDETEWLSQYGTRGIYFVPIFTHGKFWGVITLEDHTRYRSFDEGSLDLLESAAHLCADAVVRAEMAREIRLLETEADKIFIDSLTGIYNRRYFDENIEPAVRNLSRSSGWLSVMMIDIDDFKNYNDTYGHGQGDKCLMTIADTLSKSIMRSNDFIARYGGDEFIVVLPNTVEEGAKMLANKFLENVRTCKIPHKASTVADCVTISIGVTMGMVHYTQNEHDYIKQADEMLYIAKQKGRNRFIFKSF